jgi:hypothetical protein
VITNDLFVDRKAEFVTRNRRFLSKNDRVHGEITCAKPRIANSRLRIMLTWLWMHDSKLRTVRSRPRTVHFWWVLTAALVSYRD